MLLDKLKVVAAKLESTLGTGVTLADADAAYFALDPQISYNTPFVARTASGSLSHVTGQPQVQSAQYTHSVEMYKNAPWAAILMPSLGFVDDEGNGTGTSWRRTDDYTKWSGLTLGHMLGRSTAAKLKSLRGALGRVEIVMVPGEPIRWNFTHDGARVAEADGTQFVPAFASSAYTAAPALAGATITLNSTAICFSRAVLAIANTVSLVLCGTSTGGIAHAWIEDTEITLSIDPLEELVATRDDLGLLDAKTLHAFSLTALNDMSIVMPKLQRIGLDEGARNGLSARTLNFRATMNAAAGDELVIDFDTTVAPA